MSFDKQGSRPTLLIQPGANVPNSVADCAVPFPADWLVKLREINAITNKYSYLLPYWYRAGERWVLYDAVPECLIAPDVPQGAPILGHELLAALNGPAPRDLEDWQRCPYVSDMQHEMWRIHRAYVRPFWVLQGERGGHQVKFSPWQQNVLIAKGMDPEAPAIGSLPACPFDNRVIDALNHLNRLHKLDGRIDKLLESGTIESANAEMENIQREIREAEMKFIETQMTPLVDMSSSLISGSNTRSEHRGQVIMAPDGTAARAKDAYEQYRETGIFPV